MASDPVPFTEQVSMPVNYHARYKGAFVRFLDTIDNLGDEHPNVRRPVQFALRQLDQEQSAGTGEIVEGLLATLLVKAYRSGRLP